MCRQIFSVGTYVKNMSKTIIIGHLNPDTDSIVSAIAAEELFKNLFGVEAQALRAGNINNETKFVFEKFGVSIPELVDDIKEISSVALVDHNEQSQTFNGLDYANVDYVIDHHKLSIQTEKPILCRVEAVGSTATLIAKMSFEKGISPSEKTAKILLAGILSDTLNLSSPTTTSQDKELVEKLNEIAKLDRETFVAEMFKAKSSLEGISIEDIVSIDYKTFEMGGKNVGIGTWETTNPESVDAKKDEIIKALADKKAAEKLDYIFFMVVDILKQHCQLYVVDDSEAILAKKVFGTEAKELVVSLEGVVSRKKQIVPPLMEELGKLH